jgi:AcrR family transcriptional regulator
VRVPDERPTRERIVDEAMRLFGERGYAATTVADIESAAGLAGGGGGLYRHFRSKRALLEAGVRRQIRSNAELLERMAGTIDPGAGRREQVAALGRAGIARLEQERDLNRLVLRDLRHFPDLLETAAEQDVRPVLAGLAGWLQRQGGPADLDTAALAAVLAGATTHYWVLRDVFGEHPSGVSQERYLDALARLVVALLEQ